MNAPRALPVLATAALLAVASSSGCAARSFLRMSEEELSPGVRVVLGGGGNSVVLLSGREALLVDVKFGDFARRLRSRIERDLGRQVRRIVLTHAHADHAGGLDLYRGVGAVLVHPSARARLPEGLAGRWDLPFVDVLDEVRLTLGREEVRVLSLGSGHSDGDLVVYLPGRGLVVAGDLLLSGFEPAVSLEHGGDALALARTLTALLELPFSRLVPGHGPPMSREEVQRCRDYLRTVEAVVREGVAAGRSADVMARAERLQSYGYEPIPFRSSRLTTVEAMVRAVRAQRSGREVRVP